MLFIKVSMINYIWAFIIVFSFISAVITGSMQELSSSVFSGGSDAVELCLKLLGSLCLWNGVMNIAEKSGLCEKFAKLLSPVINFIFPKLKNEKAAKNAISMNITANLLGMGNAATPLGIKAMKNLQGLNSNKEAASQEMMTFVVMNTAALRIIPSTVAALRDAAGAAEPMDIIFCVWISSGLSLLCGIAAVKIIGRLMKK